MNELSKFLLLTIKSTHFERAVGQISRSVLDKVWFILVFFLFCLVQGYLRLNNKPIEYFKSLTISLLFGEQQKQYYQMLSENLKAAWEESLTDFLMYHGCGFDTQSNFDDRWHCWNGMKKIKSHFWCQKWKTILVICFVASKPALITGRRNFEITMFLGYFIFNFI